MIDQEKSLEINGLMIEDMLVNLLSSCYKFDYADISGHFYQLALQTAQTDANIIGPLKPPTGVKFTNKMTGRSFNVTKKVEVPQEVEMSVWCVRGFYPETGIPFKMTMWKVHGEYRVNSGAMQAKVSMGTFGEKDKWTHVHVNEVKKYIEEIAEKTLLSQPTEEIKKPKNYKNRVYKCMSPKGLPLQKKSKK